jgi:predicted lactoylglutathione lyase
MVFINLAVADVAASTKLYEAMGASRNPLFSNEQASAMMWSDSIMTMLLHRDFFQTFTKRPVGDARVAPTSLTCLSRESREAVDATVAAAVAAGAKVLEEPQDHGFMYGQGIEDLDGHAIELMWMDPAAAERGPEAMMAEAG